MGVRALIAAGLGLGTVLWLGFILLTGVDEPWDHPQFWIAYLAALALAALLGSRAERLPWIGGVALIFAMLPVMILFAGAGSLLAAGVLVLAALSIPAAAVAWLGWRARGRPAR